MKNIKFLRKKTISSTAKYNAYHCILMKTKLILKEITIIDIYCYIAKNENPIIFFDVDIKIFMISDFNYMHLKFD